MGKQEYKNAPVSEVIFGVTFNQKIIEIEDLFELRQIFKNDYPSVELSNPLTDVILEDSKLINQVDVNNAGPFRLRLRSKDSSWLLQIQLNKFYLNWIRKDSVDVGNYPGYKSIKELFNYLFNQYLELSNSNNIGVSYFDLTYHDRVLWKNHIEKLNDLHQIIDLNLSEIHSDEEIKNVNTQFTYNSPSINGYGILKIDSQTSIENLKILKFEKITRGKDSLENLNEWFDKAHKRQLEAFKENFNQKLLKTWK